MLLSLAAPAVAQTGLAGALVLPTVEEVSETVTPTDTQGEVVRKYMELLLLEERPKSWPASARALGRIRPVAFEALPIMIDRLSYTPTRIEIAKAIALMGPAVVPILRAQLKTQENERRRGIIYALGELGQEAEGAVEELIDCTSESDPHIRANAAIALGKVGGGARVALSALKIRCKMDPSKTVRGAACSARDQIKAKLRN